MTLKQQAPSTTSRTILGDRKSMSGGALVEKST